jgi:DNA repair protein RadC
MKTHSNETENVNLRAENEIKNLEEVKLVYEPNVKMSALPRVTQSNEIFKILSSIWETDIFYIERFYCLFFNRNNRLLGYKMLSMGSQVACVIETKTIFQASILMHACSIAIAHNHPSGNLQPSDSDRNLTNKLVNGLKLFDITLLDHIILSDETYFSFADSGLI